MLLQMQQDVEKEPDSPRKHTALACLGLRLTHTAADPMEAANFPTWFGGYVADVASSEAVRDQVVRWKVGNLQLVECAHERKLEHEFTIQQAQTLSTELKIIVTSYPELAGREGSQLVDVRKDDGKFISPQAKLVGAESEIIEIR